MIDGCGFKRLSESDSEFWAVTSSVSFLHRPTEETKYFLKANNNNHIVFIVLTGEKLKANRSERHTWSRIKDRLLSLNMVNMLSQQLPLQVK